MLMGSGGQPEQWLQGQRGDEGAQAEGSIQGRLRNKAGKAGRELIIKGLPEELDFIL